MDLACSQLLVALLAVLMAAYAVHAIRGGAHTYERVERERGSAMLWAMRMGYWSLEPIGRGLVRVGIRAAHVTWSSLLLGVLAGVALATRHFGCGAALACVAALGDALDGIVAREAHAASRAGELLDASVDRYIEASLLGGIAIAERGEPLVLFATIAALTGSFMVSYSTAKAEALGIVPPRGGMRRPERVACLIAGATLTPLLGPPLEPFATDAPIALAVAVMAVISNGSAIRRLHFVYRALQP